MSWFKGNITELPTGGIYLVTLTVLQHLVMSPHLHTEVGFLGSFFILKHRERQKSTETKALELLSLWDSTVRGDKDGQ